MRDPQGPTAYAGAWTYESAAHLLRRCMFGPTYSQIKEATQMGLGATVEMLLEDLPLPSPPINTRNDQDPHVPIGETWVEAHYSSGRSKKLDQLNYRRRSLKSWTIGRIMNPEMSIREKMTLFWHNHFPVNDINDPKLLYDYVTKLREHGTGNFRTLVKEITLDPAMLRYLNGDENTAKAPNENYARELLELFTIGKGPQIGPGDYTHYTEQDVKRPPGY